MPGTRFKQDSYVNCPYYCKETPVEVKCVGICGDHTLHHFKSGAAKNDFKADFCCGYYWNCPCYIALDMDGK
jgi:hypothetical protein